jgi:hypothetical protein
VARAFSQLSVVSEGVGANKEGNPLTFGGKLTRVHPAIAGHASEPHGVARAFNGKKEDHSMELVRA